MADVLHLNYPAPIPVGHRVEVTVFADPRPEPKRGRAPLDEPNAFPVVVDLETGIRFMNHVHAARGGNGGNTFNANRYPLEPRADLSVARVYRAVVEACTIVSVEGLGTQHTTLSLRADQ